MTDNQIKKSLIGFTKTLSNQPLVLASHQPEQSQSSKPRECISNVQAIVAKKGGEVRFGWYFQYQISSQYGDYLIAVHHAVWRNPNTSMLVDVTPYVITDKHQPLMQDKNLVFLLDDKSTPIRLKNLNIPLPSHFYALNENTPLTNYVRKLQLEELGDYEKKYNIKVKDFKEQYNIQPQ